MKRNEKLLQERAERLAQPLDASQREIKVNYLLVTLADGSEYGIIYEFVESVVRPTKVSFMPGVTPAINGVINWRGNLLTVVDLNVIFHCKSEPSNAKPWVVVVKYAQTRLGLLVSSVLTNQTFLQRELSVNLSKMQGAKIRYVQGIIDKKIAIIDMRALFSSPDLKLGETAQQGEA